MSTDIPKPTAIFPDLAGKTVLVTGASRGIGRAIAEEFAKQKSHLMLVDINEQVRETAAAIASTFGTKADFRVASVTDSAQVKQVVEETVESSENGFYVLVNNAGITRDSTFKKMDRVNWDAVMKTNLDSCFNMTKQVCDSMVDRNWGRIINISSVNGQKGAFGQVNYSAAKAGMHGFTKALALEVARKSVTVNTISPGYIGTKMVMAIPKDVLDSKIIPQIPMGRLGKPEEVAGLVAYLASEEAAFVTGANIAINGGQHMF